jgi:hypothetical protein
VEKNGCQLNDQEFSRTTLDNLRKWRRIIANEDEWRLSQSKEKFRTNDIKG